MSGPHELAVLDALDAAARARAEELIEAVTGHDAHPPFADAMLVQIHGAVPMTGVAITVGAEDGSFLGLGLAVAADLPNGVWNIQEAVHPEHRGAALRAELARRGVEEARRRGARRVQWWAVRAGPDDDALAASLGLAPWRDLVKMTRPLSHPDAPELPAGLRLRAFEPGRDEAAWVAVNQRAFASHPEQGAVTQADLRGLMAETWFDAGDFLLAERDGDLAGFCWVKVPGDGTGEIYVIGTDPVEQGAGLGRALVLAGLARMVDRGAGTAGLYADGDNEPALALYGSLGFTRDHVDRAYVADAP